MAIGARAVEALVSGTSGAAFWRGKRVLLTGHTGFKGAWLALWLRQLGAEVTGLALEAAAESLYRRADLDRRWSTSRIVDLRDAAATAAAVRAARPQIVLHLAAQALVRASYRDPLATFATNTMGTAHLLDALRDLDDVCVAVVVTTDKVYRNNEWPYPYREDDALGGHDPYSASKAAAELVAASYRSAFLEAQQTAVATARAGNVIGGGDWSEDRLIPDAVRAWQSGSVLTIRRPQAIRPWQHVLDPLAGYLRLAERLWHAPNLAGAYNFGPRTDEAATVGTVVALARAAYGSGEWRAEADEAGRTRPAGSRSRSRGRARCSASRRAGPCRGGAANDALVPAPRRRRVGASAVRSRHRRSRGRGGRRDRGRRLQPRKGARRESARDRGHAARRPEARAALAPRRSARLPGASLLRRRTARRRLERAASRRSTTPARPQRGSVRGLHFQRPPRAEKKLVQCLRGEVFDVAVDLRRGSPTFLQWHGERLSGDNGVALLIPEGFAHGLQTLAGDVDMLYCHSVAYAAESEGGVHPRDPRLAIDWPLPIALLSPRDEGHAWLGGRLRRNRRLKCRHCAAELDRVCLDLGSAPPSNAYLTEATLRAPEVWYPLRLLVCERCWLVQTEDHAGREALFGDDYAYFSSFSSSWLAHAEAYVEAMRERFGLSRASLVSEVAANDGYLLRYVQQAGHPVLRHRADGEHGAGAARALGLDIVERFFGVELARELAAAGRQVDLVAANNVLAHVPDINDFVAGFAALLKPDGVATFEFPHLLRLLRENQFDTVYHEHYSYLSLTAVQRIFAANGLAVFDVEEHADAWRQPARVRAAQRHRPARRPATRWRACCARKPLRAWRRPPATRASRRASTRSRTTSWRS